MKKIEVCFLCDHSVGDDGEALERVEITSQIALFQQKRLKSTVCFSCFRRSYKHMRANLEQQLQALKRTLVEQDSVL